MKRPLYNANDCFYFLYTCVISIFYWCAFILSSRTEIFFGGHINYRFTGPIIAKFFSRKKYIKYSSIKYFNSMSTKDNSRKYIFKSKS